MTRTIIYGATDTGKSIYNKVKDQNEIILFVDDDPRKWGDTYEGISVEDPRKIIEMDYDKVIIGVLTYRQEILDRLHTLGIPDYKIDQTFVLLPSMARIKCIEAFRIVAEEENIGGNVAELGVFRGEFAAELNRVFSDRILYLFDTFEGFDSKDTAVELSKSYSKEDKKGYFSNTSVEYVLSQMVYPEKCVIRQGYFPHTTEGVNDTFCFVNLDADLYQPTVEGLRFFYPRMETGGMILVHDFFSKAFLGVKDAVREFCAEEGVTYIPIGDTLSVAIRKM